MGGPKTVSRGGGVSRLTEDSSVIDVRRIQVFVPVGRVFDDEIVVKDGVVALQLQLEAPTVAQEIEPDFMFVLGERSLVTEMLGVNGLRLVVELFVVVHVIT